LTRRSGLGKGLGALIPVEPEPEESISQFRQVDISEIIPNRNQPRSHFDEEALTSLAASIAEIGVVQPVIVREIEQGYEIIAGERRWRAAQRAGLRRIPALLRGVDDQNALETAVVENVHRQDLNALEEAAAYRQLMDDFGLTQETVATRVGRSRSAIANTTRLLNLSPSVQRLIVEGQLSAGHGRALLSVDDEQSRETLAAEIVREGLTVRETENRASELSDQQDASASGNQKQDDQASDSELQAGILELEELLSTKLNTPVSVKLKKSNGTISIRFGGIEDLERIYGLIMTSK